MDLSEVMRALDGVVLEHVAGARFVARSALPAWCRRVRPHVRWDAPVNIEEVFPFLAVFLPEAERAWCHGAPAAGGGPVEGETHRAPRVDSDLWAEADDDGDVHLIATATQLDGARALVVMRSERVFADRQALLQRARELRLAHDALMRGSEQKDILIHAIVHDLAAPLHSVIGVLSLLVERVHRDPEAGWLEVAMKAATRQRDLIGEILDVFVAEGSELRRPEVEGVDLTDVIARVVAEREPPARGRGLRIAVQGPMPPILVSGEETRLFRVLTNLVDNASRYSPRGGVVRISALPDDGMVTVCVDDDGPGVRAELLPRLFEKFAHDGRSGSGLGLFFCRITVEGWGGAIGYEPRASGGARFWFRLRRARPTHHEPEKVE